MKLLNIAYFIKLHVDVKFLSASTSYARQHCIYFWNQDLNYPHQYS